MCMYHKLYSYKYQLTADLKYLRTFKNKIIIQHIE